MLTDTVGRCNFLWRLLLFWKAWEGGGNERVLVVDIGAGVLWGQWSCKDLAMGGCSMAVVVRGDDR